MLRTCFLLFFSSLLFTSCENTASVITSEQSHWEYENPDWQNIGYAACNGNAQSPIDIETQRAITTHNLPDIEFNYQPMDLITLDNTHTIQVNAPDNENYIIFNHKIYYFAQFHLHEKSEHMLDALQTEMELHLVHQDSLGNLVVLAYLITEGNENVFLQKVFNHIPADKNIAVSTGEIINLNEILPAAQSYYTYAGSLTTPPCSGSVQFIIFKEFMEASAEQISFFKTFYTNNRRPVQPLNNRFVLEKN